MLLVRERRYHRKSVPRDIVDGFHYDNDEDKENGVPHCDPKIEKEIEELSKMPDSGAAKMILQGLKKKKLEVPTLDPRSSSRTPSAALEPPYKTRYESSLFACKCSFISVNFVSIN